jgi:hypothetical protein
MPALPWSFGPGLQLWQIALLTAIALDIGVKRYRQTLYTEIKTKYSEAVDHSGNLLVESFKAQQQ